MNIDWFTFVAQIVNFVVLVYLLNHFLYGPITEAMKRREESIVDRLTVAEKREADAQAKFAEYRALSDGLESQRKALLEQARSESEQARLNLLTEARNEVELRREDWLESLHREQSALIRVFRQRAGQQVVEISRNALSQLADAELERQSLERFVQRLGEVSATDKERLQRELVAAGQAQIQTAFELQTDWRNRIEDAVANQLGLQVNSYITVTNLVCGIELHVGGIKIGWSVEDYLQSLADELEGLLAKH